MAEYSLEYGMDWYDFSIRKVSETLEPGMYVPCICEGFGFVAIAKDLKGKTLVQFQPPSTNKIKNVLY